MVHSHDLRFSCWQMRSQKCTDICKRQSNTFCPESGSHAQSTGTFWTNTSKRDVRLQTNVNILILNSTTGETYKSILDNLSEGKILQNDDWPFWTRNKSDDQPSWSRATSLPSPSILQCWTSCLKGRVAAVICSAFSIAAFQRIVIMQGLKKEYLQDFHSLVIMQRVINKYLKDLQLLVIIQRLIEISSDQSIFRSCSSCLIRRDAAVIRTKFIEKLHLKLV